MQTRQAASPAGGVRGLSTRSRAGTGQRRVTEDWV